MSKIIWKFKDKSSNTIDVCKGCNRGRSKEIYFCWPIEKNYKHECPCSICIVKMMCGMICADRRDFHIRIITNWIDKERNIS